MMRRFVGEEFVLGVIGAVLTFIVVVLTGASAGATYLIAFGFLVILAVVRMRPGVGKDASGKAPPVRPIVALSSA